MISVPLWRHFDSPPFSIYVTSIKWRVLWKILTYSPTRISAVNHPIPPRMSHCNKYPTLFTPVGKWREVCWGGEGRNLPQCSSRGMSVSVQYMLGYFFLLFAFFWRFIDYGSLMRREDGKRLSKNRCRGFSFPQRWGGGNDKKVFKKK